MLLHFIIRLLRAHVWLLLDRQSLCARVRLGSGAACRQSPAGRPASYLCVLGESERILDVHPEVAHRALDFGVTQEQLHRPQVARRLVDDRRLGPAK